MENIKFVTDILLHSRRRASMTPAGNFLLCPMSNGNVAKICCETNGIRVEIINKKEGTVDRTLFPFTNYFSKKKTSDNAPLWDQHIENGKWYFAQYPRCLPTALDFKNLASAVDDYLTIME